MHDFHSNHFDPNQSLHPIAAVEIVAADHFVVDNHQVVVGIDKGKIHLLDTVDIVAEGTEEVVVENPLLRNHVVVVVVVASLRVVEEKTLADSLQLGEEEEALVAVEVNS